MKTFKELESKFIYMEAIKDQEKIGVVFDIEKLKRITENEIKEGIKILSKKNKEKVNKIIAKYN